MELYNKLAKLLNIADNIEKFENQKKINHSEKEKEMKQFIELLISVLKIELKTKENKDFRLYFMEYLRNIISSCFPFCSEKDKNEIENLLKSIRNNNKENNNQLNMNIIEDYDIKNQNSENYELQRNNSCYENNNNQLQKHKNNFLSSIKEEKPFYSKNYKNIINNDDNKQAENKILNNIRKDNHNLNFYNINETNFNGLNNNNNSNNKNNIFNDVKNNINFIEYELKENKHYEHENDLVDDDKIDANFKNKDNQVNNINFLNYNKNNPINNNANRDLAYKDFINNDNNQIINNNINSEIKDKNKTKMNKIINNCVNEDNTNIIKQQNNNFSKDENDVINNNYENEDKTH